MKKVFAHLTLTNTQKIIVNGCIQKHEEEYSKWYYRNLLFPIGILVLTFLIVFFKESSLKAAFETLINGGLSILGFNILFAMSSYLIRTKSLQNDTLRQDVVNLSGKFSDYTYALIPLGSVLYVIQIGFLPDNICWRIAILVLTCFILWLSVWVGVRMFMIRDEFYEGARKAIYEQAQQTGNRVAGFLNKLQSDSDENGEN